MFREGGRPATHIPTLQQIAILCRCWLDGWLVVPIEPCHRLHDAGLEFGGGGKAFSVIGFGRMRNEQRRKRLVFIEGMGEVQSVNATLLGSDDDGEASAAERWFQEAKNSWYFPS